MKAKTLFYCTQCGNETPKWAGRCPSCGAWNTVVEQPEIRASVKKGTRSSIKGAVKASAIIDMSTDQEIRFSTGMGVYCSFALFPGTGRVG